MKPFICIPGFAMISIGSNKDKNVWEAMQHLYVFGTEPLLSKINFNWFNKSFPFLGQLQFLVMTESNTGFSEGQMIALTLWKGSMHIFYWEKKEKDQDES